MNAHHDHPDSTSAHWLRLVRSRYSKPILLEMEDGRILSGQARDMNAKGFFLHAEIQSLGPLLQGMRGFFLEDLHGERIAIPCQVVRITQEGVGVQFTHESQD